MLDVVAPKRVLTFDNEFTKYVVSAPASCSRVLQIDAQK